MKRKLHIGGKQAMEGWEVLNAIPGPCVDHVCNANDLSLFSDATFSEVYASHVLEHFDYAGELLPTLHEWFRVLEPRGKIHISVPDLDVLAGLILSKDKYRMDDRFAAMRMIFGGHTDKYDYHVAGLNEEFLTYFLDRAGFTQLVKVNRFGLFDDSSDAMFYDTPISLNMVAKKPHPQAPERMAEATPAKAGRNDPCPCGSGKKYKKCHGAVA